MNFKNILLLISIISLIFVCVGGVAAHPGHGHEYIEEVSSSSDSPQSAPSHSGSYQQSHSSVVLLLLTLTNLKVLRE